MDRWVVQPGRYCEPLKQHILFFKKLNVLDFQIPAWWLAMRTAQPEMHLKPSKYCKFALCFFHVSNACWLMGRLGAGLAHLINISNDLNLLGVLNTLNLRNTCLLLGWMVGCVDCVAALADWGLGFPRGVRSMAKARVRHMPSL